MSLGDDSQPTVPGSIPAEEPASAPPPTVPGEPPVESPGPPTPPRPEPSSGPAGPVAGGPVPPQDETPKRESLIDAVADLLQMIVNYLRQETSALMRDKVVLPGQQLGMLVAFALAAAALLVIGLGFIFVAVLMVLAQFLGWPGALALVGTLILIGAGVLTYLKVRSIQT